MGRLGWAVLVVLSLGALGVGVVGLSHLHQKQAHDVAVVAVPRSSDATSEVIQTFDGGVLFGVRHEGAEPLHTLGWLDLVDGGVRTWAFQGTAMALRDGRALLASGKPDGGLEWWLPDGSRRTTSVPSACTLELQRLSEHGDGTVLTCADRVLQPASGTMRLTEDDDTVPAELLAIEGHALFNGDGDDGVPHTFWLGARDGRPKAVLPEESTLWHVEHGLATVHTVNEVAVIDLRTGVVKARAPVSAESLAIETTLSMEPLRERGLLGCEYLRWTPATLKRRRVLVAPCVRPSIDLLAVTPSLTVITLSDLEGASTSTLVHDDGRTLALGADGPFDALVCTTTTCLGLGPGGSRVAVDRASFTAVPVPAALEVDELTDLHVAGDTFIAHRERCLDVVVWAPGSEPREVALLGTSACSSGRPPGPEPVVRD